MSVLENIDQLWPTLAGGTMLLLGLIVAAARGKTKSSQLSAFTERAPEFANVDSLLQAALKSVSREIGASEAYVLLAQKPGDTTLQMKAEYSPAGFMFPSVIMAGQGVSGLVYSGGQRLHLKRGKGSAGRMSEEFGDSVQQVISVPICMMESNADQSLSREIPTGTLTLISRNKKRTFSKESLGIVQSYANIIAFAVGQLQMQHFMQTTIATSLTEIADLLEAKDPRTAGHCYRVGEIAELVGQRLGLGSGLIQDLKVASRLLDIGNIAVPDSILKKESKLSPEEYEVVQAHSAVSYEICKKLRLSESLLLMIRNHHERMDGSGYPDQLRGAEIPQSLRIIIAADSFDALMCSRPHRPAFSMEKSVELIRSESGSKLDQNVVEVIAELAADGSLNRLYQQEVSAWVAA